MPDAPVYLTGLASFYPGEPVDNDGIERRLGLIGGKPSRLRSRILANNGIKTRHYAVGDDQRSCHSCRSMAAQAVRAALANAGVDLNDLDALTAATTQADLLVPGFGSQVHAELGSGSMTVTSVGGVCSSGVSAIRDAFLQVRTGEARSAVACAAEFPSRTFKASQFEGRDRVPFNAEFLRWMLSDAAGAAVLCDRPRDGGTNFRVDWVKVRSHADRYPLAMYAGTHRAADGQGFAESWLDRPSFADAAADGLIELKQDVRLLDGVVKFGVDNFLALVDDGTIAPGQIDWFLCHYSSLMFKGQIQKLLQLAGCEIPEDRWFSNLDTRGNVGAASAFVLLDALTHTGKLRPGQKVILAVPESGGSIMAFAALTVHSVGAPVQRGPEPPSSPPAAPQAPQLEVGPSPVAQGLVRDLARVWLEFESSLGRVPIVRKLHAGQFQLEDYKRLLLNLRQQVVEGGRWIARAASNVTIDAFDIRSSFIGHAQEEHRDYQMLERDYVSVGGDLADIQGAPKNIGSEALSAWMFQRASRENPFDLLGAMFIIEGLGQQVAHRWARSIREQLGLNEDQVSFLAYHGVNDERHFEKLEKALSHPRLDETIASEIVKTAKVTARLYRLQLEELDHF